MVDVRQLVLEHFFDLHNLLKSDVGIQKSAQAQVVEHLPFKNRIPRVEKSN